MLAEEKEKHKKQPAEESNEKYNSQTKIVINQGDVAIKGGNGNAVGNVELVAAAAGAETTPKHSPSINQGNVSIEGGSGHAVGTVQVFEVAPVSILKKRNGGDKDEPNPKKRRLFSDEEEPDLVDDEVLPKKHWKNLSEICSKLRHRRKVSFPDGVTSTQKTAHKSKVTTWKERLRVTPDLEDAKRIGMEALEENSYLREQVARLLKNDLKHEKTEERLRKERDEARDDARRLRKERDRYRAQRNEIRLHLSGGS